MLNAAYVDQARLHFELYLRDTLAASQRVGGRFNPPGEFGALYTASDSETAWAEVAARFQREGIPGLPPEMGILGLLITGGRFADLCEADVRARWDIEERTLVSVDDRRDRDRRWSLGRAVRALGDFLRSPSARRDGANIALFVDREGRQLAMTVQFIRREAVPDRLAQKPNETW